ncbi:hypothetical protein [Paraglaciecola sp.]|uniref:hypothetical protein n=1 Tax=Paraglaciecola sp. TaxID=1920173 RepID=UPI003266DCC5
MSVLVDNTMELINPYLLKAPDTALSVQSNIAVKKHSKKKKHPVYILPVEECLHLITIGNILPNTRYRLVLTQSLAVFKRIE